MTPERAMRVKDVAAEYNVTPDTVYGWLRDGRLRGMRLPGGEWRFRRAQLEEFDQRCLDQSLQRPITASVSEAASTSSTGQMLKPASRDPFLLGRQSAKRPTSGTTSG